MKAIICFWILVWLGMGALPVLSQNQENAYPRFQFLRAQEDYQFLSQKQTRSTWEKLKYIPLSKDRSDIYLSLGGDIRTEAQALINENWSRGQDNIGIIYQRFMAHTDWHLSQSFRIFGQLKSGFTINRNGEPIPLDQDLLDVHQLFVEFKWGASRLQIGRKELWYGSRRLISIREGTNVRQSFDGGRWIWEKPNHRLDALFYLYNPQRTGAFDNNINDERKLWGLYYVWNVAPQQSLNFDFYYLGVDNQEPSFEAGSLHETRHSLGIRHWGKSGNFSYNHEAVYQFGKFGQQAIRAWTASIELYYGLPSLRLKPKLGLKAEVISGDQNAEDGKLQTFNPLYPRGGYFGLLALIGPANLIDLHPSLSLDLGKGWELNLDWDAFWRYRSEDGIYFPSGRLNVPSGGFRSHFIGHQLGGEVVWGLNRFLQLEASCFYFVPGDFIKDTTEGADLWQIGTSINFKF